MSSRSMKRIWLRLDRSSLLPIQLRAALVISPPATMNAWSTRTRSPLTHKASENKSPHLSGLLFRNSTPVKHNLH